MFAWLGDFWRLRFFLLELARHDVKERYRRSFLGIGWSLLKPAAITLILSMVFTSVFDIPLRDYAPFLFLGLVVWQFLAESILQGCNAFRLGSTYLRVRPMPLAIFPLRVVLSSGVHGLLGLGAGAVLIVILHGRAYVEAMLILLPTLAILVVLAWSLACLAAIFHTMYSDTQHVAEISLQVLFYATPVIYLPETVPNGSWLAAFVACNPMASILELIRRPLLHGELPGMEVWLVAVGCAAAITLVACAALKRVEKALVLWL